MEANGVIAEAPEVDGVDGALPETVVILTFMPSSQWPDVPQAK